MEEKEKILPEGAIIYLLENKFGIKVKKHANTYSCKCPFHDDRKPSALVSPQTNTFACTVCGSSLKKRWYEKIGKEYKEEHQKHYYIPAKAVAMLEGITKRAMTEEEWKEFLKELKEKNFTPIENNKRKNISGSRKSMEVIGKTYLS